jgi:hypothetical protein
VRDRIKCHICEEYQVGVLLSETCEARRRIDLREGMMCIRVVCERRICCVCGFSASHIN